MGQMTSSIFFRIVAKKLGKTEKTITEYFEKGVIPVIMSEMDRGNTIIINGFGTFTPIISGGCDGANGEYIEEFKDFSFKPNNAFLNSLNNGKEVEKLKKRVKTIADVKQKGHAFKDIGMEEIRERMITLLEKKLERKNWHERKVNDLYQNVNSSNEDDDFEESEVENEA